MKASYTKHTFQFKTPSGTSRGILTEKHAWFLTIWNEDNPSVNGVGECSIIPGLSPDFVDVYQYETKLNEVCSQLDYFIKHLYLLVEWPSILFGLETALLDVKNGGTQLIFDNAFSRGEKGITINGLIWMGDANYMLKQIDQKIEEGYSCLKMKIGAIDFNSELTILASIRNRYSSDEISLRLDANGAFSADEAHSKLLQLAQFSIHSIEQPIAVGQWDKMKLLCEDSPIPVALDEELIGMYSVDQKESMLSTIKPHFIILKPSLHGGIRGCQEWIKLADKYSIPWWITSALESNIGLNAIAQFTAEYQTYLPQGLGTGSLYTNNVPSKLYIDQGQLLISALKVV